jgi:hypothetical protein
MLSKHIVPRLARCIFTILLLISQLPTLKGSDYPVDLINVKTHSGAVLAPIDETIAVAAPHLPVIRKWDGSGDSFKFKRNTYLYDEKILKTWIQTYPDEFTNYCIAMKTLLKNTKESTLTPIMKTIYTDLKAQYFMIKKTI